MEFVTRLCRAGVPMPDIDRVHLYGSHRTCQSTQLWRKAGCGVINTSILTWLHLALKHLPFHTIPFTLHNIISSVITTYLHSTQSHYFDHLLRTNSIKHSIDLKNTYPVAMDSVEANKLLAKIHTCDMLAIAHTHHPKLEVSVKCNLVES